MDDNDISIFGTAEGKHRIWLNTTDASGISFAVIVWLIFCFLASVVVYFTINDIWDDILGSLNGLLLALAAWSHLKSMITDPGSIPLDAKPLLSFGESSPLIPVCGVCECFKPPRTHHDRVSNRCIGRMDHFCPWTNNAVGVKNQKHFILFLIYADSAAISMYTTLVLQMLSIDLLHMKELQDTALILARISLFLLLFVLIFTSAMIGNQIYGLYTGLGTIDRMKVKTPYLPYEASIPVSHVFGDNWWFACLPIDPYFDDREAVLQYRTHDRYYVDLE